MNGVSLTGGARSSAVPDLGENESTRSGIAPHPSSAPSGGRPTLIGNSSSFMNRPLFLLLLLLAGAVWAADPDRKANTVVLNEIAVKNLGIETTEAEERTFEETVFALGRIKVAPGHRAVISSRVPGRALQVTAHIDTRVEKGAEAVVLESRQPGDPPPTIKLFAPLSGLVSTVKVVPGQPVNADDSLIEIIDLNEVHAVAAVPEHLTGKLKPGMKARIRVAALPEREFTAELAHIGAEVEETGGTIEAAFHVENADYALRPGMRAEFSLVIAERENVMSIPRQALGGDIGGRYVFIKDYELKHAFVKTPVRLGTQNEQFVEVLEGLLPGDEVVTRGAYPLAFSGKGSVSLKEALDAAHGHPHNEDGSEMSAEDAAARGAKGGGDGHHAHGSSGATKFFAATSAVLFLLLFVVGGRARRRGPSVA
jgi:membrane fusion protein, heavy metal efflux system